MPNRILKDSICTSDNVDDLTAFQETFFYRLIVNCDDYGRMDARAKILAARLFPLKSLKEEQVKDALRALAAADLILIYEVDGRPYLQMKTWERHQQVRAAKSKYPSPDEGICKQMEADGSNCKQMISDDSKCPRNPIQSESESNPNPKRTARAREEAERFDRFWMAYPRKENKQKALAAFVKLHPDEATLAAMLAAIERQKASDQWQEDGGRFIPHPTTWLNGKRWEDETPKATGKAGKIVIAQQYQQRDYSGQQDSLADALEVLRGSMM